jgi:hypothetical protein
MRKEERGKKIKKTICLWGWQPSFFASGFKGELILFQVAFMPIFIK